MARRSAAWKAARELQATKKRHTDTAATRARRHRNHTTRHRPSCATMDFRNPGQPCNCTQEEPPPIHFP